VVALVVSSHIPIRIHEEENTILTSIIRYDNLAPKCPKYAGIIFSAGVKKDV